jgi:hypothetical protein
MPLEEQTELFANRIKKLGRFQFLLRPAIAEGHIGTEVVPMTIRHEDRDPLTGEYQFPDQPLVQRVRAALAKQSGIPIQRLLSEQEKRLAQGSLINGTLRNPALTGQQPPLQQRSTATSENGREDSGSETPAIPTRHRYRLSPQEE